MLNKVDLKQVVDLRNKRKGQTKSNNNNNSLIGEEITSDDLAIIGAGLTVLGDLFAFLSLVKVREEETKAAAEEGKSP
ncbi:hypothetical protein D3C76_928300 [compost metagenome]